MWDIEAMVPLLRQLNSDGRTPSEMLHLLAAQARGTFALDSIIAFQKAFGIPLAQLSIIGGWMSDGSGEIGDARIDKELGPAILATRGKNAPPR